MIRFHAIVAALREWIERSIGTVLRRRGDRDLAGELAFHIEQTELDLRRRGYTEEEAYRLARVRSGSADRALEQLRAQSGIPWLGMFKLDVLLGVRMLRKFWGLSLTGGLAMALAIGICACVYLYFDVMWNTKLPLDEGDRVVAIQIWDPSANRRRETSLVDFARWRDALTTLEDVGAFRTVERTLVLDGGDTTRVQVAEMSAAGFRVARTAPLVGRAFVRGDERPGAAPVAVIGYQEWQRRFGGDPNVVGRTLRLDDTFYTIVGVMPEQFGFPINHRLWIPLRQDAQGAVLAPPGGGTFARLAPGFGLEDARAELGAMGLAPGTEQGAEPEPLRLTVLPYAQNFVDDIDPDEYGQRSSTARLVILLMSLLLVPPGVNIAILVYARTVTRQEEIAVRTALGASRARIVAQLFVEMLVLSAAAAAVALAGVRLVAYYVETMLLRQLVALPFWVDIRLSPNTIAFAAVLAVAAALLTGLVPALRATKRFARPGLSALESRNRARLGVFWTALIVAQVAFSFAALPVATELAWGVLRAHLLGPGFPAEQYLSAQLSLDSETPSSETPSRDVPTSDAPSSDVPSGDAPSSDSGERQAARFARAEQELFERLRTDPAVTAGPTLVSAVPGDAPWVRIEVEGQPGEAGPSMPANPLARWMLVDAAYFDTFDARPLAGRLLAPGEFVTPSTSVLVSERFVERTLGGATPLGLRLRHVPRGAPADAAASDETWYDIVGVVPDVPAHAYRGTVYVPLAAATTRSARIVMRVAPGSSDFGHRLSAMAAATDPPLRLSELRSLDGIYAGQALANYIGGFALIAGTLSVLLLAAAGTYALMSFTVHDRRREIGIRVALGAPKGRLLRAVLRRALRQMLIGALVGVSLAAFIEQKLPAESFGGIDLPGVLPAGTALVILVGLFATLGPARRALRIDPTVALRDGA